MRHLIYKEEARRLRIFEGQTLSHCPTVLVASEEDGSRVRDAGYSGDAHVVPGIIDFLGESTDGGQVSSATPSLVFHGNLFYTPNEDAITAFVGQIFPKLQQRYQHLELMIVGARPSRRVRALAGVNGVRVIADVAAMSPWLRPATAVIAPMRIGAGHSQKICEALLERRPVICTPQAAQRVAPEVRPHLLVASDDAEWIAHVGRLLDDPAAALELGERGHAAVRKTYSADAVLPILEDIYLRCSKAGSGHFDSCRRDGRTTR